MLHGKLSDYLYDYFDDAQYTTDVKKQRIEELRKSSEQYTHP